MTLAASRRTDTIDTVEHQSQALLAVLEGCNNPGVTRCALLIRTPLLPPGLRRPHHLRLIRGALEPLRNLDRAGLYLLADDTMVACWRGPGGEDLRAAHETLDQLFADLPEYPVGLLDLPRDEAILRAAIAASLPDLPAAAPATGQPLDPARLLALETALGQADIAPFIRRRPVCFWPEGENPRLAWHQRCLSVRDLAATLAPGVDLRGDPWLFRRLTRSFDRRMLALLADPYELRDAGAFALDLNVSSIVETAFLRFDAALPSSLRGKVTLGLRPDDILGDPAGYAFARDFARARSYRLALRGVSAAWLHVFPPDLLGLDRLLVEAEPGAPPLPPGRADQTVLCRVADQAMLEWGWQQGIRLFEGPFIRPDPQTLSRLNLRRVGRR